MSRKNENRLWVALSWKLHLTKSCQTRQKRSLCRPHENEARMDRTWKRKAQEKTA